MMVAMMVDVMAAMMVWIQWLCTSPFSKAVIIF